jgi:hypothetical protein
MAAEIEELHHMVTELDELIRSPALSSIRPMMREARNQYQALIDEFARYLTKPRVDEKGVWFSARPTATGSGYDWMTHRLMPNMLAYAGFICPSCKQGVYRTKRPVSLGQGRKAILHSCWCIVAFNPPPPPGSRIAPVTLEVWSQKAQQAAEITASLQASED